MRYRTANLGVLALAPFTITAYASDARAQDCAGIGVTGEVCSEDRNNPALEQQRRSDEAAQQAREQYEAQARQRDEEYERAVAAERDRAENERRRAADSDQTIAAPTPSAASAGGDYARQPAPQSFPPGPAKLSTNPAVAAYQRGNFPIAFSLTRAQARKGDLVAWHNLGIFYEHGIGTRPDPALALQWFRACADRGAENCQYELARINYYGALGVARDPVEAYKWMLLAGQKSAIARSLLPEMRLRLSPQQLAEAMRRYEQWKPAAIVRTPDSPSARGRH